MDIIYVNSPICHTSPFLKYNIIAIILFASFILFMNNHQMVSQFKSLFHNDIFKIIYLTLILLIDIKRYPYVTFIMMSLFFYFVLYLDEDENMENIEFVKNNIL